MSRFSAAAFCVLSALACGLGCSGDHSEHDKSAQPGPSSSKDAGNTANAANAGSSAAVGAKGDATHAPATTGGADAQNRADASLEDPDAPAGGDTPRASTGEAAPPDDVGSDCFGGKADTMRHSAHCGACGNACAPFVLASGLDWPVAIALDATTAYWVTTGDAAKVMSAPLVGGAPATLADAQPSATSIAIDATNIYWASYGNIRKVPLAGGTPTPLLTQQANAQAIAIDREYLYWTEPGDSDLGSVNKVPLEGGDPIRLATVPGSSPSGIAVDATSVYWVNSYNNSDRMVLKVALAGGDPITLAHGSSNVYAIALDTTSVYWVGHDDVPNGLGAALQSFVSKAALDGGTVTTLATGSQEPQAIAIDHVSAYWTNSSTSQVFAGTPGTDGLVLGVPLAGGSTVTLAPDQDEPAAIASNGTSVCWTTFGTSGQGSGSVKCLGTCSQGSCR